MLTLWPVGVTSIEFLLTISPLKKSWKHEIKGNYLQVEKLLIVKDIQLRSQHIKKAENSMESIHMMFDVRGLTMIFWPFFSVDFSRVLKGAISRFWLKRTSTTPWRKSLMKDWKTSKKKENQSQRVKKGGKNLSNYRERKWSIQDHL